MPGSASQQLERILNGFTTQKYDSTLRAFALTLAFYFLRGYNIVSETFIRKLPQVLVFMLVALNDCWKIPVGYFLLDGLSASEKARLAKKCLEFVQNWRGLPYRKVIQPRCTYAGNEC